MNVIIEGNSMKKEAKKEKKEHEKALKPLLSHLKKDEMKLEKSKRDAAKNSR